MKLKQIKTTELKKIRKYFHGKQKQICPVLQIKVPLEKMVCDHKHKTKKDVVGKDGNGLIRGVIHSQANVVEGKISSAYVRYGLHKFISLPDFLRNLADYLENPPLLSLNYIHPSEKPKAQKLQKRSFNQLSKLYKQKYPKRKALQYPKSGKLTKSLEKLFTEFNIEPIFLKRG